MPRTADVVGRQELLDRVVAYVYENGLASLSLRPLAKSLGVSPAILLYHFESKERLGVEVLERVRAQQRALFERMRVDERSSQESVCHEAWRIMSERTYLPLFKLFFEVYGLALQDPERFPGFFAGAIDNWLAYLERPALRAGASKSAARIRATIVLAGFRGFLLDLCATREKKRIDAAVDAWIASLGCIA